MSAPPPAEAGPDRASVQSFQRAARLLRELASSAEPRSALELARATGLERTVVHRLLRTMLADGFVEGDGRYGLGPGLLALGNAYVDRLPVRRAALPFAVDLQNRVIGERPWIVGIAVPVGAEAVLVDRTWSATTPLGSLLDIGTRLPIDRSAHGRCLLSCCPADEIEAVLGPERAAAVATRLDEIREAGGVDASTDERRVGISAIAAVISSATGRPAGSIAISGAEMEGELDRRGRLANELRRAADGVAAMLA